MIDVGMRRCIAGFWFAAAVTVLAANGAGADANAERALQIGSSQYGLDRS